jgi:Tol biopolymer transport system component
MGLRFLRIEPFCRPGFAAWLDSLEAQLQFRESAKSSNAAERSLVWVDRTGREERIDAPAAPFAVPRVSPDGGRVVAHLEADTSDVIVTDLRRHHKVRLTFGKSPSIRPMWSADGKWVLFRSDVDGPAIYRKASDGGGSIERVTPVAGDGSVHAVTPDGRKIIYAQISQNTARDLWMVDIDGKDKPQPLVVEPGDQANAVISPDGRWLAYHSSEVGEIYVRPFPNVVDGKWQLVTKGAKWPLWSRDGKELFYVTARGIMSIAVDTSQPTFHWGSPTLLFEASYSAFPGLAGPRTLIRRRRPFSGHQGEPGNDARVIGRREELVRRDQAAVARPA